MLVRFPSLALMMLCPLLDSPRRETISQQPIPERERGTQEKKLFLYSRVQSLSRHGDGKQIGGVESRLALTRTFHVLLLTYIRNTFTRL